MLVTFPQIQINDENCNAIFVNINKQTFPIGHYQLIYDNITIFHYILNENTAYFSLSNLL